MGPLEKWLLANAEKLDLQIRFFDNHLLESLGIFDLEAEINIEGKKYWGRGTSFDREVSLKKACSEAIERFFLHKNKFLNSNGMAAHISEDLAIETAKYELIERDLFLCRYLTKTPFFEIQHENMRLEKVARSLSKQGINLKFYSMGMINSISAVLCAIDGLESDSPFGYILGSSAGERNLAIESSFLEAYRNFAHHKYGHSITLAEFDEKCIQQKIDFKDHGNLALDTWYAQKVKNDFFISTNSIEVNETINLDLSWETLSMDDTSFAKAPILVVRISSPNLVNLFVGNTIEKNLNSDRLKSFCESYGREYKLYTLPHPFN